MPLLVVSFALFEHVARLRPIGIALRDHLVRGLLPPDFARTILEYLARFMENSSGLPLFGFVFLAASSIALLWSVESTLNRIWQVKEGRSPLRRIALYVIVLPVGPAIIGASLWATSQAMLLSDGLAQEYRVWWPHVLDVGAVILGALGFTLLFRFVPNTTVRWRNAAAAGLLASLAFELGKRGFAILLSNMPVQQTLYGALAPLLALLMWVYYSWFLTLGAALIGATMSAGKGKGRAAARQTRKRT